MTIDTKVTSRRASDSPMSPYSCFLKTRVTASHWQLKNLLIKSSPNQDCGCFGEGDSTMLYYTQKNNIQRIELNKLDKKRHIYDEESTFSSPAFNTDITPATIDECDGILALGGHCLVAPNAPGARSMGYFSIYFPQINHLERKDVGKMINNSVTINKVPGSYNQYLTYICNNDRKLYSAEIRNSNIVMNQPMQFESSLNNCKVSPDFKTVVATGDSSDIYLIHPEQPFKAAQKIKTYADSGFSTEFLKGGIQFATCFQSGETYIYDIRNMHKPIHTIFSTRKLAQGSFRNIRVADPMEDLLFITEHEGRIHMIDTRSYEKHMVIMMPTTLINNESDKYDNDYVYNQPIIKPYRVIKEEIPKFGGEIEKSIHSYRSTVYPYVTANDNDIFNRNTLQSVIESQRYSRFDGVLPMRLGNGGNNSNYAIDRVERPRIVGNSPSLNMLDLHSGGISHIHDNIRIVEYDDDDEEAENGIDRPLRVTNDIDMGIGLESEIEVSSSSDLLKDNDMEFTWTRQETGKEYNCKDIKNSKLFQYNRDTCPIRYSKNGEGQIEYVLDLQKRRHTIRNGWDAISPLNDPFHFVDSTMDILGLEVLNYGGDKVLAFASPEGVTLWSINKWKRQCYPVHELC